MKENNHILEEKLLKIDSFEEYLDHYELFVRLNHTPMIFEHVLKLLEGDDQFSHHTKESMISQKRVELKKYYMNQIEQCMLEIQQYGYYITPEQDQYIDVVYHYPRGKRQAIQNKLIHEFGEIIENDGSDHLARISTQYNEEIAIMFYDWESFSRKDDPYFNQQGLYDYFFRYNRIKQLDHYIYMIQPFSDEFRGMRSIRYPDIKKVITTYNRYLKEKRDQIYQELLIQKEERGKWKSEQEVFLIIHQYFPDALFQYKPDFLEGKSLDIYIPSIQCAIEYQGLQHFEAIEFFGGKEALEDNQRRDQFKRFMCKSRGIKLIYWYYFDPVTIEWFENIILPQLK